MDNFEKYLFNKITDFNRRFDENVGNKEIEWFLDNCIEQFMEIMSEYNLNHKIY